MSDRHDRIVMAEERLLSALLWRVDLLGSLHPRPRASDFVTPESRAVFAAIVAVREAEPTRVEYELGYGEVATVAKLESDHNGDARRLVDHVLAIAEAGLPAGAPAYVAILRAEAERTAALRLLAALHREGEGEVDDVRAWLDRAAADVARIAEDARLGDLDPGEDSADLVMRRAREIRAANAPGAPDLGAPLTGLMDLDKLLVGFRPGEVSVIAARPGIGKTAFLCTMAASYAAGVEEVSMAFLTVEQHKDRIGDRLIAQLGRVPLPALQRKAEWRDIYDARVAHAATLLQRGRVTVYDVPGLRPSELHATLARHKRAHGRLDLAFVDHLLEIQPDTPNESRAREVADIMAAIRRAARSVQAPILVATQINRESLRRAGGAPTLGDLKESGAIEEKADLILLLHRAGAYDDKAPQGVATVRVAKQREGATGSVDVAWKGEHAQFADLERRAEW